MPPKKNFKPALILLGLACAIAPLAIRAQDEDDEDIILLDPFVVTEKADGYVVTSGITGTRVNVAIKQTPIALEVLTAELLEDQGATGFKDSLAYTTGIFTESAIDRSGANPTNGDRSPSSSATVGDFRNNSITIRGFNAPFQQRMGFRLGSYIGVRGDSGGQGSTGRGGVTLGGIIDTINVDRIEIVRGPGALLYGLGVISGIANIIPKEPLPEFHTNFQFGVGTNNYFRSAFDATGPILRREEHTSLLDYRVMASYQEEGNWSDYYLKSQEYYAAQMKWHPKRGMSLFAEFQGGTTRFSGIGDRYLYDNNSPTENYWRDSGNRMFANPFGERYRWGVDDWVGRDPTIWDSSQWPNSIPPDQLSRLEGPFLDAASRYSGPDTYYNRDEWSGTLRLNWTINENLAITLGGFHTRQDIDEFNTVAKIFINAIAIGKTDSDDSITVHPQAPGYSQEYAGYGFGMYNPGPNAAPGISQPTIYRGIAYYWTQLPTTAESTQFQADVRYEFETSFLNSRHSFLLGRQEVKDVADIPLGTKPWGNQEVRDRLSAVSFYDWDQPLRYNGEEVVSGGAEYYTTKLWYQGSYLVYHGRFFDDRFAIIGGVRRDRFEAYEERWNRITGTNQKDFEAEPSSSDEYGAIAGIPGVEKAYYNFDEAVSLDTGSIGLTVTLTDSLNAYAVMAQGVIPNTGVRDGAGYSIPPEETLSREIGIKFDFMDARISGTLSIFQIDRENAIWDYQNAPAPGKWLGGRSEFKGSDRLLDSDQLVAGAPRSYAVDYEHFIAPKLGDLSNKNPSDSERQWRERLGFTQNPRTGTWTQSGGRDPEMINGEIYGYPGAATLGYTGILGVEGSIGGTDITDANRPYVYIDYDWIKANPDSELKQVLDEAFSAFASGNHDEDVNPINYRSPSGGSILGINASANNGGAVTFEEQATGIDGQIIFTLLKEKNMQLIFNFAHVEREATSDFNLVAAIDGRHPELGDLSTEYDVWVKDLGADNFADPTDPTTLQGGIKGKSLYYGAEDSASLWTKYTFIDGPVEGLEIGLGARYVGPMQTSIPIGSDTLAANRYETPDTEAYYQFDAALIYTKRFDSFDFRVRLNLYNLLDKDTLYSEVHYDNVDHPELSEDRRSIRYLEPFRMRLTAELKF